MNNSAYRYPVAATTALVLAALACGGGGGAISTSEPKAAVAPMTIGADLTVIDVCQAVPTEDVEAVMGRKLKGAPSRFDYYQTPGASGCQYDGGKDSDGEAHFGYVVLTPVNVYAEQPIYLEADVPGLGDEAYFNNGADARQLWVKIDDKVAFVVAFGDVPKEDGALSLARLVAVAIQ